MVRHPHRGTTALLAALLALVCLGIAAPSIAAPSNAAEGDSAVPTRSPEEAKLTKVILGPKDTNASTDTYTFHFAGAGTVLDNGDKLVSDGVEQDTLTITAGDVIPSIPDQTLNGRKLSGTTSLTDGQRYQSVVSKSFTYILENVVFPHAGVYTYQVTESGSKKASSASADDDTFINNSKAAYIVRITVKNDDSAANASKTSVENITAVRVTDDDGKDSDLGKVDPYYPYDDGGKITKIDDSTSPAANTLAGDTRGRDVYGLTFANEYITGGKLQVKKIVKGDFANKTSSNTFDIKLELRDPITTTENAKGAVVTYAISGGVDHTNNQQTGGGRLTLNGVPTTLTQFGQTMAIFDETTGTATIEAALQDGGTITITGIFGPYAESYLNDPSNPNQGVSYRMIASTTGPSAGQTYTVTETNPGNYTPSAYVKEGDGVTDPTAEDGSIFTATASEVAGNPVSIAGTVGTEATNVYIVNTLPDSSVSPTGIFIDNLPYVLMVGVPLGVFAAMFVARRRRNAAA